MRTEYNLPVGIKDGQLYMLYYTVDYEYVKAAIGKVLEPQTEKESFSKEQLKEFWQSAAYEGNTEDSLKDYVAGFDASLPDQNVPEEMRLKYFPDAKGFKCVDDCRRFTKGMEFDIIIDAELIKIINKFEE